MLTLDELLALISDYYTVEDLLAELSLESSQDLCKALEEHIVENIEKFEWINKDRGVE